MGIGIFNAEHRTGNIIVACTCTVIEHSYTSIGLYMEDNACSGSYSACYSRIFQAHGLRVISQEKQNTTYQSQYYVFFSQPAFYF